MLTDEIRASLDESVLCWLATVDADGAPSCSPKEIFVHHGASGVAIADIASPGSARNVRANPEVCVSFVHVLKQKGFKLKGRARYVRADDANADGDGEALDRLRAMAGEAFPIRGMILVEVRSASRIAAPGYHLVPGTTEASQVESARRAYGV